MRGARKKRNNRGARPAPGRGRRRTTDGSGRCAAASGSCRRPRHGARAHRAHRPSRSARSDRSCRATGSAQSDSRAPAQSAGAAATNGRTQPSPVQSAAPLGPAVRSSNRSSSARAARLQRVRRPRSERSRAVEPGAAGERPTGRRPAIRLAHDGGPDLALQQRPRDRATGMALRDDGTQPEARRDLGRGLRNGPFGGLRRRVIHRTSPVVAASLLITLAHGTGLGRRLWRRWLGRSARWCNAKCTLLARVRLLSTRSKSTDRTRRPICADRASPLTETRGATPGLRRPGACGPWRGAR